jgi:carbohydrate kinase (thermoresistant glucokinase family)
VIIVVSGVSGSGKSTIGQLLARRLSWLFLDADDFHSSANIAKMSAHIPLTDADRKQWLTSINQRLMQLQSEHTSVVLACSALKQLYRVQLAEHLKNLHFVQLTGDYEQIKQRIAHRAEHFMQAELLQSQFEIFEPEATALSISTNDSPANITSEIMSYYQLSETLESQVILSGLMFPESPRWHHNKLWFTDQHAQRIMTTDIAGKAEIIAETPDLPGGLGWLPDGTLLVVYMTQRKVYQLKEKQLTLYADLSAYASFHCNDMIVSPKGDVWVGNFGYDLNAGEAVKPAELVHISTEGKISVAAEDVIFPNGCVLSADARQLIVAETFASRISQFDIQADGSLCNRQIWANLLDAHPDGICQASDNTLWIAAPNKGEVWNVTAGGRLLARVKTHAPPYACMLGGEENNLLFITSSTTSDPGEAKATKSGFIEIIHLNSQ